MTILVGSPVQNRSFVIEDYLRQFQQYDYVKSKLHLAFLVNNSKDDTLEKILEFRDNFGDEFSCFDIQLYDFDYTDRRSGGRDYNKIAEVKNAWMSMNRAEDTHFFMVDSDVIAPSNALKTLLERDVDIISALVPNVLLPDGRRQFNIMKYQPNTNMYKSFFDVKNCGVLGVDVTGACCLYKREVWDDGAKFKFYSQGEDVGFCRMAKFLHNKVYCDTSLVCEHKMTSI
jgi:GT2 family glycosyltransferase